MDSYNQIIICFNTYSKLKKECGTALIVTDIRRPSLKIKRQQI